jgi:hypothetical protein
MAEGDYWYDVFVRREGLRWRWTVLCVLPGQLLGEWTGLTWTERGADKAAWRARKRDHLARRD